MYTRVSCYYSGYENAVCFVDRVSDKNKIEVNTNPDGWDPVKNIGTLKLLKPFWRTVNKICEMVNVAKTFVAIRWAQNSVFMAEKKDQQQPPPPTKSLRHSIVNEKEKKMIK